MYKEDHSPVVYNLVIYREVSLVVYKEMYKEAPHRKVLPHRWGPYRQKVPPHRWGPLQQ